MEEGEQEGAETGRARRDGSNEQAAACDSAERAEVRELSIDMLQLSTLSRASGVTLRS